MSVKTAIRKVLGVMLAVMVAFALLAGPAAAADKKEERRLRAFCASSAKGDKAKLKMCLDEEEKAKARLKGRKMDSREEAYCKGVTGGSYTLFEKCIERLSKRTATKMREKKKTEPLGEKEIEAKKELKRNSEIKRKKKLEVERELERIKKLDRNKELERKKEIKRKKELDMKKDLERKEEIKKKRELKMKKGPGKV